MGEPCAVTLRTPSPEIAALIRGYYQDVCVRERICEFLGGTNLENATAIYIAGTDGYSDYHLQSPPVELSEYLEASLEVDRSLWDKESLIADIDLEYNNFDHPERAWLDPERAFELQQPVLDAIRQVLACVGIAPLILVSGRGFHFVWAVRRKSQAFRRLTALGHVPERLQARYARPCGTGGWRVEPELGRAFSGLGLIIEFVGHRVIALSSKRCNLSVQPAAIEVGPGIHGREVISFDLSEYGDPLDTRHIRMPFSAYLKPRQLEWALGEAEVQRLLPIFEIPLADTTSIQAISSMRDVDAVLNIARQISVHIPDESEPMNALLDEYEQSELAAFHRRFYAELPRNSPLICREPACLHFLFEHPNDWLLKPAALQHVVRVLTALGWNPSAIAQRIYGSYSQEHGWGDIWKRLEPCNRSIFYTRLFAGMIATGLDKLIDFNCVSHQEKGYCMIPECSSNLLAYRNLLIERIKPK